MNCSKSTLALVQLIRRLRDLDESISTENLVKRFNLPQSEQAQFEKTLGALMKVASEHRNDGTLQSTSKDYSPGYQSSSVTSLDSLNKEDLHYMNLFFQALAKKIGLDMTEYDQYDDSESSESED